MSSNPCSEEMARNGIMELLTEMLLVDKRRVEKMLLKSP
jgi:hypothetical protein